MKFYQPPTAVYTNIHQPLSNLYTGTVINQILKLLISFEALIYFITCLLLNFVPVHFGFARKARQN